MCYNVIKVKKRILRKEVTVMMNVIVNTFRYDCIKSEPAMNSDMISYAHNPVNTSSTAVIPI